MLASGQLHRCARMTGGDLAVPSCLSGHFRSRGDKIHLVYTLFVVLFFVVCASSKFISTKGLFGAVLKLPCFATLLVKTFIIMFCAFLNKFSTIDVASFVRKAVVFFAIVCVPITTAVMLNKPTPAVTSLTKRKGSFFSFFPRSLKKVSLVVVVLSSLN